MKSKEFIGNIQTRVKYIETYLPDLICISHLIAINGHYCKYFLERNIRIGIKEFKIKISPFKTNYYCDDILMCQINNYDGEFSDFFLDYNAHFPQIFHDIIYIKTLNDIEWNLFQKKLMSHNIFIEREK